MHSICNIVKSRRVCNSMADLLIVILLFIKEEKTNLFDEAVRCLFGLLRIISDQVHDLNVCGQSSLPYYNPITKLYYVNSDILNYAGMTDV